MVQSIKAPFRINVPRSGEFISAPFSNCFKQLNNGFKKFVIKGFLDPNQRPAKVMFSFAVLESNGNSSITKNTGQIETFDDLNMGAHWN